VKNIVYSEEEEEEEQKHTHTRKENNIYMERI